jgi:uncharacterized membrane protein YphA (DoxX/SURF4 family)
MNTALWIIQGLLAAFFFMPGAMKLITPTEKLREKMKAGPEKSLLPTRILGLLEVLGAIGIIIPYWTGILPLLTPLAAVCFAIVMVGAVVVHAQKHEYKLCPCLV